MQKGLQASTGCVQGMFTSHRVCCSSREQKFHLWNFHSGSESMWERKFQLQQHTHIL